MRIDTISIGFVLFSLLLFSKRLHRDEHTHTEENLLKHNLVVLGKVVLCAKYTHAEICKFVKV